MIFSRKKLCRRFFLCIFVLVAISVTIEAGRTSGGRSRSGGGRSRGGGRTGGYGSSAPHVPSRTPSHPSHDYTPPKHTPYGSHDSPRHQPVPSHPPKDSSTSLIHSEGGGKNRPGGTVNDQKQQQTPHQPSAPKESFNKVTVGHPQSQAPGSSSQSGGYPPWANPSLNPHAPNPSFNPHPSNPSVNPHPPNPSSPLGSPSHGNTFPTAPYNPGAATNQGKQFPSAPYPPTHPNGPISPQPIVPVHASNQNSGTNHQSSYPYPTGPHGAPPPYQSPSAPYPSGHPPGMPMPTAPHVGFGNRQHGGVQSPIGAPPAYHPVGSSPPHGGMSQPTIINNHYHNAPPLGSPQNPAGHPVYGHAPVYGGAPVGQPFVPGQTVVVMPNQQSGDNGRGLGQIFKEALVFSTVNAGVNRLINGPSHHHDSYPSAQPAQTAPGAPSTTSTVTNTVIYNYQPGTQPPAPGSPPGTPPGSISGQGPASSGSGSFPSGPAGSYPNAPGSTSSAGSSSTGVFSGVPSNPGGQVSGSPGIVSHPSGSTQAVHGHNNNNGTLDQTTSAPTPPPAFQYYISNDELTNLTETLFFLDEINVNRHLTVNLQNQSTNVNSTKVASFPLLYVPVHVYDSPTIHALRDVYKNYEFDSEVKETRDSLKNRDENLLLEVMLNTNVMSAAMRWLSEKGYVEPDDFEWKDTIRHIWMSKINGATSGFERIFMGEKYPGPSILGAQNWIYYDHEESSRRIKYMSYVDKIDIGDKAKLVKINFKIDDVVKPNTTMLIGTPPELELALYTVCYYTRPNDLCPISLGGAKFSVYTHAFRYFGKDVIDLGFMYF